MLFEAEAGPELWPDALAIVVYLLNRRAVSGKPGTPVEMFYGRKPRASHLRIWGCLAYVKVPDRQLNAIAPRSVQGMFIGYERGTKGYTILVGGKKVLSTTSTVYDWSFQKMSSLLKQRRPIHC